MTNRIEQMFSHLKKKGRKALIGYVTAGFPKKNTLTVLAPLLGKSGLDLLELGVPFSDPIADGPTIQRASQVALANGVTLSWVLQAVSSLRSQDVSLPIVLMSYSNPILSMGLDRFFTKAKRSGVDGLIVPDLIPEEGRPFETAARKNQIDLIYLVAPTTPSDRLKQIAKATRGFLYAVSLTGVTGARDRLPRGVTEFLTRIRRFTTKPVAVGFGLSSSQHIQAVRKHVHGVIVGSALIHEIERSEKKSWKGVGRYVSLLQKALNPGKETSNAS